jgi:hypothetical protein
MIKLTLKHKIRLLVGIHGQTQDGTYLYFKNIIAPKWLNKLLNTIIGFKPGDWKK